MYKRQEFYVEEQTNIAGVTYLLVSDSQDEEADAYILKDISAPGSTEACYEMVEDDDELQACLLYTSLPI